MITAIFAIRQEAFGARSRALRLLLLLLLAMPAPASLAAGPGANASAAIHPHDESGLPFIHHFDSDDYGGSPQNWSLTQDRAGMIYAGNTEDGVLVYDGVRWQRIPVPGRAAVRSLATAPDGRIYVGTVGDFGFLGHDRKGQPKFFSLLDKVPVADRDFADVWSIRVTPHGVYFATFSYLFHLDKGRITAIKPQTTFHLVFQVDGTLYAREVGRGLMRLVGNRLQPVPGGGRFAEEKIYALLPWKGPGARPGELLAGTRTQGWFLFDGRDWHPWPTEADQQLKDAAIYQAIWLADGRLAVATLQGGVFLLDRQGHLLRTLTRASGLTTNVVLALYQDRQRGLWLATDNGISRVDIDSPLSRFGERVGLRGAVVALTRHAGTLYAGTTEGLYRLASESDGDTHFEQVTEMPGQTWAFAEMDDQLLAAGYDGVFAISDGKPRELLDTRHATHQVFAESLLRSRSDPSRVFVGYQDGIGTLLRAGDRWIDEGRIAGVPFEARSLEQDADGRLWVGLWDGSVIRLTFPSGWQGPRDPRTVTVERFGASAGLPAGQIEVVRIDDRIRFTTAQGIYRFDPAHLHFAPDPDFAGLFPGPPRQITAVHQDRRGELWMYTADFTNGIREPGHARRVNGRWAWTVAPLQPLAGSGMNAFIDDPDGVVWLGGDKGLFRFDRSLPVRHSAGFTAVLREVTQRDGQVLFAGDQHAGVPRIPYAQNALRFEFAAPSFDMPGASRFQVQLEGLDSNWSPWSREAYRDYTNLPAGDYRFRVRARDVYGEIGKEATFSFAVLPPWYRTAWAWTLWIAGGVLLLALALRWRLAAVHRHNRELSLLVDRRTAELQAANEALATQSMTDALTGLKNRRYLYEHIEQDVALARRHHEDRRNGRASPPQNMDLLFLMVDIDHFKDVNDTYGHAAGDRVLQQLRDILMMVTRESDTPVRWGGEEFLIVARFAPRDFGPQFAERVRAAVAGHRFDLGNERAIRRTCSIGFASYPVFADDPDRLNWEQVVNLADECLYAAKRHSRNAWVGVAPMQSQMKGNVVDALRETLARGPEKDGPLRLLSSWTRVENAALQAEA